MLYVQQSLNKDEELVYVGHFHWMYNVQAVMAIVWGVVGCIAVIVGGVYVWDNYMGGLDADTYLGKIRELHPAIRLGAFLVFVLSLLRFAQMMVVKATTEIAVTTSRLIFKRGLVARYVGEMSIDRIEGVNVLQTILGRIFNYGRVMVRGMGVGEVILPPIADPIAFRKAIDRAKSI
ncbi:PH domain-containing protein [Micavibrio aeruginosavorus]|uniref:Membrane-flanked domain protein n=1 Tax=Micavibrio aeruginosavorus EPB TaxID=349215 RepID=M4VX22_9BACT|nr:PH domain-containing protein [Micavibrio aeruginosavorus]AGH97754.1 membrane-flanked domain protein [Micavibrio aeruginosavorus EPB]